jgi:hypothetical protein
MRMQLYRIFQGLHGMHGAHYVHTESTRDGQCQRMGTHGNACKCIFGAERYAWCALCACRMSQQDKDEDNRKRQERRGASSLR